MENEQNLDPMDGQEEIRTELEGMEGETAAHKELMSSEDSKQEVSKNISDDVNDKKEAKPHDEEDEVIDSENAEDAEDNENVGRHQIPFLDYESMSMENLVGELQRLVKNEKVQTISKHVYGIKSEFDIKFQDLLEIKKQEFVDGGGNEIDFRYNSVAKRQFNEVYKEYREKKEAYQTRLEKSLKENLKAKQDLIEELKGLLSMEEDINTTYNHFKVIQEKWKSTGPVPRNHYSDLWRTYRHHMERFYDFLHLNREFRDLDFKHNLEEKEKLIEKAEALAQEPDLQKALRELQTLHKIWKEDIGPVAKEIREEVWQRFSMATKVMHDRRQAYYDKLDKAYEANMEVKLAIIQKIHELGGNVASEHKLLQKQMTELAKLREAFFKAGKVPMKKSDEVWKLFKEAVQSFNRKKNAFYKSLKKDQLTNLDKKKALLAIANELKDSGDFETATNELKRIQSEWKKIGHVPRKYSDAIWEEFKAACNHYFDRLHAEKSSVQSDEIQNLNKKEDILNRLKAFTLSGDKTKDLPLIKGFIQEWKAVGHVPFQKKHINSKFNRIIDVLFKKLDIQKHESELLRYGDKIKNIAKSDNQEIAIGNERVFLRKKIDEGKAEVRQLENNMQFFSNSSEDNPLVKDVIQKIKKQKEALEVWKSKLKNLNILENRLEREANEESENNNAEDILEEDS